MDKLTTDVLGLSVGVAATSNVARAMRMTKKPTTKNMLKGFVDLSLGINMTKAMSDSIK